jgi:ATP dependent DNA ligase domain
MRSRFKTWRQAIWIYELKFDGYRALAFKGGKNVRLISRNKKEFNYPQLLDGLKSLPADHVILDGEIAALDSANIPQSRAQIASYLSAFFEFESADMAVPYHAFIVNYVAADDFGHHGQIEVADFRIAFGEIVKDTIGRLDSRPFLFCRVDRPRLIA